MTDPMAEIKASFFIECEELLESLFDALQMMADGSTDSETINIAFRAVHSIKGGAGAFALDDLVSFAHVFETTMDELRAGRIEADEGLINLFFTCGDVLSDLVRASRDEETVDDAVINPVLEDLKARSGISDDEEEDADVDFVPMTLDLGDFGGDDTGADATFDFSSLPPLEALDLPDASDDEEEVTELPPEGRTLRIIFKPTPELYSSGNEPLYFLRALAELGACETTLDFDPPDDFDALMPLGRHLAWTIVLTTQQEISAVSEIFEFADGLCHLEITDETVFVKVEKTPDPALNDIESADAAPSDDVPQLSEDKPEPPNEASSQPTREVAAAKGSAPTVRVSLDRIDRLVNLVGELVINQSMLSQSVSEANLSSNSDLDSGLEEFLQLTRDIQESVMMIRAQPVKSLFQRMSRIVRESSALVEKSVKLVTEGETTEIDKTAIERLADPLTHMIRNSVDHGLEKPQDRLKAGKPETGEIRLSATHKSGRVVIEISDDGAGINRPRVKQIAIDKGLIAPDAQLADSEIDQLLFLPGFSTSEKVSNLSGRGVGMDVVKSAISALGGKISIVSNPGEGTTFSISLPLTLAVVDGMIIGVENETLVIPLNTIAETLTLRSEDIRALGAKNSVLRVRDGVLPLVDLGCELGYRTPRESYDGSIALLIAQEDGSRAALIVDEIEDQRQVVIKGLQESYGHVPGIAAATILGNGQIALILDPSELIENALGPGSSGSELKKAG